MRYNLATLGYCSLIPTSMFNQVIFDYEKVSYMGQGNKLSN